MERRKLLTQGLQLCCFFVFTGRAWQHIVWDAPYRTLLWDESLLSTIVPVMTGMSWNEYATSPLVDQIINGLMVSTGICYLFIGLFALVAHQRSMQKFRKVLLLGSALLFGLALLYFKEKFYQVGQLFEYSIQFGSPLLLYMALQSELNQKRLIFFMKVAIALTFTCHGLYALGYYPQPGNFVAMTINILPVDEETARGMLKVFGWADILLSILLFVPKASRWALLYAAIWGLATAVARIWANIQVDFLFSSLNQWSFETIMRLPHGIIPLLLISPLREHFRIPFIHLVSGWRVSKYADQTH